MSATNFEIALLSGLLAAPEHASLVVLSDNDFSTPTAACIFKTIKSSVAPTHVTIAEDLTRAGLQPDAAFLSKLFALKPDSVSTEELEGYALEVREDAVRRRFQSRLITATNLVREGHLDQATSLMSRALSQVAEESGVGDDATIQGVVDRMSADSGVVRESFPSGLTMIDQATGGLRHSHIWIISARFKGRKSSIALNVARHVLEQGRSVAYVCLEDDDIAFAQNLMAQAADFSPMFFDVPPAHRPPEMRAKIQDGIDWMRDKKVRFYDARSGVHNFNSALNIMRADKIKFGTDLFVIDYVQAWSEAFDELASIGQRLQKFSQENNVCLLELSQMSGATIKDGSAKNYLSTKGSTVFGQACHVGIELRYEPDKGQRRAVVKSPIDLGGVSEVGVHLKVARRAPSLWVYCEINPESGRIVGQTPFPTWLTE